MLCVAAMPAPTGSEVHKRQLETPHLVQDAIVNDLASSPLPIDPPPVPVQSSTIAPELTANTTTDTDSNFRSRTEPSRPITRPIKAWGQIADPALRRWWEDGDQYVERSDTGSQFLSLWDELYRFEESRGFQVRGFVVTTFHSTHYFRIATAHQTQGQQEAASLHLDMVQVSTRLERIPSRCTRSVRRVFLGLVERYSTPRACLSRERPA